MATDPTAQLFFDLKRLQRDAASQNEQVPILRPFDWLAPTFTTFRERPLPGSYLPVIQPTAHIFGTSRLTEVQFAQVDGPLGQLEVLHGPCPAGFYRHYLAMQYNHTDATVVSREFAPVRVVTSQGGGLFPSVAIESGQPVPDLRLMAVRNVTVPPLAWIGARIGGIDAAANIVLRVLWIEIPVGESFESIE